MLNALLLNFHILIVQELVSDDHMRSAGQRFKLLRAILNFDLNNRQTSS